MMFSEAQYKCQRCGKKYRDHIRLFFYIAGGYLRMTLCPKCQKELKKIIKKFIKKLAK